MSYLQIEASFFLPITSHVGRRGVVWCSCQCPSLFKSLYMFVLVPLFWCACVCMCVRVVFVVCGWLAHARLFHRAHGHNGVDEAKCRVAPVI